MNNVDTRGRMLWDDFIRVPADETTVRKYHLLPGDVLFNNTNSVELVGKTALFTGYDEPVVYSNHFTRLRVKTEICEPAFLAAWLLHQWNAKVFENLCNRWIGQSAVKYDKLSALDFPLPPLPEQRRIAARLRDQMAAVERARRAALAQNQASSTLYASYLRDVFDNDTARKWPSRRLGDVLIQRRDVIHPHDNPTGPATFVGLEHIESTTGRRNGSIPLEMSALTGRKPRFAKGDIVYGYLRPYLNKVWIADFDGLCSVDQFAYEVRGNMHDTEYIAWFMRSPVYLSRSAIETTTGQLPRIGVEEIAAVEIPFPSQGQRRAIAEEIKQYLSTLDTIRLGISETSKAIELLPAALLREAFSGGSPQANRRGEL